MSTFCKLPSAEKCALPEYAHVPGMNKRHNPEFLECISGQALSITADETARDNFVWNYGLRLFDNGFYWECHEVLETVWMNAAPNSREKHFIQAIIHLTNAMLKLKMGRQKAAHRLFELAGHSLDRTGLAQEAVFMGLRFSDVRTVSALDGDKADASSLISKNAI